MDQQQTESQDRMIDFSDAVGGLIAITPALQAVNHGFNPRPIPSIVLRICIYHLLLSITLTLSHYICSWQSLELETNEKPFPHASISPSL